MNLMNMNGGMTPRTLKLTAGAMIIAIFGMFLLFNRQTGGLFEDMFMYLLPVPMVAYSCIYGWKASIPVFIGMTLFSVLFGTFYTIFYAVSGALLGMILGTCIYHKKDMTKTLLLVMGLSAVLNLISTVALASVFGFNVNEEVAMMQEQLNKAMEMAGVEMPEGVITTDYLKRLFMISMAFMGMVQGFIIYEISLLVLKRLHFPVQRPKAVSEYCPPRWSGFLAMFLMFAGGIPAAYGMSELIQNIFQTAAVCAYLYLVVFGVIAANVLAAKYLSRNKILIVIMDILALMVLPQVLMILGFFYISGGLREKALGT